MSIETIDGMTVIRNSIIPPQGYKCINIFGILFAREGANIGDDTIRHERTHTLQMQELLYIGFYILYVIFFLWYFVRSWKWHESYERIPFEEEAEENEDDETYNDNRKHYAWTAYV